MNLKTKKLTTLALSVALAMLLSFVESLVPPLASVPGVKAGFANIVTLYLLYAMGAPSAIAVSVVRIFLSTLLFGSFPIDLLYSFSGAFLSFVFMYIAKRLLPFGIIGVSVIGAVMHNAGQVICACFIMKTAELAYYFIPLFISGIIAGVAVGILSGLVIARLRKILK